MEYRILFASRTAFDNGIIDGEWIDLTDAYALEKIDAFKDAREGHEFFIGDSMTSLPMNISEYEDPCELVNFVSRLEDLDETQLEAYEAIMSELELDCEDALDKVENREFDAIEWDIGNLEECVDHYVCDNGKTIFVIY